MKLTNEDVKNILILINKATLTGAEAATVTDLQKKLVAMLEPEVVIPKK